MLVVSVTTTVVINTRLAGGYYSTQFVLAKYIICTYVKNVTE